MVSILPKIFQSFTTVYNSLMDRDIHDIFVNDDADFLDDDPEENPDWVKNEDDEEDEIPVLETFQIPTSSRYLGADGHVWSETPKDRHGRAAPATVPLLNPSWLCQSGRPIIMFISPSAAIF